MTSLQSTSKPLYHCGTLTYTRAGLMMLFFWLLWGDFCFVLMEGVIPSILPLKLQGLDATNKQIGMIMITLPQLISLMVNPVVSFRSDRFRSRWGRRIPFIVATLPMLVVCLGAIGYGDSIGRWLHLALGSMTANMSEANFTIWVIGALVVLFGFFNAFVNAVFWYLFNDVVPEHLLARFSAWFKVVSVLSTSLYQFFVFPLAQDYAGPIFIGAALLYAAGFGAMCFAVKEGGYPPPPPNVDGGAGVWSSTKTFAQECSHKLYLLIFAIGSMQAGIWATQPFQLFYYESTGLTVPQVGTLNGCLGVATAIFFVGAGWLADRYHPTRVLIAGLLVQILLVSPAQLLWLWFTPSPHISFYLWMGISILLSAPAGALMGALGVLCMRLYPKSRFGQFCSANATLRSIVFIVFGYLAGAYFDTLQAYVGKAHSYLWLPVWQIFFYVLMLVFASWVYVIWKEHGGDEHYQPPGFEESDSER